MFAVKKCTGSDMGNCVGCQGKFGFESSAASIFPPMVQLSITNVCDMSCRHCPHSEYVKSPTYSPMFMDMSLFRKIADEVGKHDDTCLRIFGWGEPLLHDDLAEMVKYAKEKGVKSVSIITNGLKLNNNVSEKLIKHGLDVLEVSLDALTKKTYENIRGGGFDIVVKNIENLISLRDRLGGKTYVAVSIINQPKAESEVNDFRNHWMKLADDVIIRTFHDFMGFAEDKEKIVLPKRYPCRCLWSRFNINPQGLVSICFNDWNNESVIGDARIQTIESIWKSGAYDDYRQSHLAGRPKGICAKCNDWIGASWKMPYEVLLERAKNKRRHRI